MFEDRCLGFKAFAMYRNKNKFWKSFPKNQNVDFKFSAYVQYRNIGKPNNLRVFLSNKIKGPKPDSKIIIQGT